MKKYEPAGGVCALKWKSGKPDESSEYGLIIFETWQSNNNPRMHFKIPYVRINAELDAASWHHDKWNTLSGKEWNEYKVRRWARLGCNFALLNLCLADWEL